MCDECTERAWDIAERDERERIINLLKDYDFSAIWRQVAWNPDEWVGFNADELIAIIEEETNE